MEVDYSHISYLIIGAVLGALLGFSGTLFVECIKRRWERKDREQRMDKILLALKEEIGEGIKRCETLIKLAENQKSSFSRIYITLWDSIRFEICQNFKDSELLKCLHQIYYRFDLINFNMEAKRFNSGAAFAKQYIDEIKKDFGTFNDKIKNK